jgi:hypothetical protein
VVNPTVEVNVVLLAVTVVRIGEVVIGTALVPLPVAPEEPELEPEPEEAAPVLATTPAPEVLLAGLDGLVGFFALEQ